MSSHTVDISLTVNGERVQGRVDARKTLVERGMKLRDATKDETEKLRTLTRPIWDEWVAKVPAGKPMLDAVAAACS